MQYSKPALLRCNSYKQSPFVFDFSEHLIYNQSIGMVYFKLTQKTTMDL